MMMLTKEQARNQIEQLIDRHRVLDNPQLQSEANVRANFIDPLFAALNWPVNDARHYNRETYVRGAGFADIALTLDPTAAVPLIFVEAKRFGAIEPLERVQERRNRDVAQLRLNLPGMSVDRTKEEQQAINYAYQNGMHWAILTNFTSLRLFNARRDTLVLSFDSPVDLLERFDELWQLSFTEVAHGSLDGLRGYRERLDIDEEYLRLITIWRLRLGQDIIAHRENLVLLADPHSNTIDIYKLREAVQRVLDRLVVIRYAEDRFVIKADQLRSIVEIRERTDYGVPLLDQIRHFFQQFNVRHNGTLFADHLCDRLTISEDVLHAIIVNLYDARFRAMSADIMGNTYEQYLGQTLAVRNGNIEAVDNLETRKAQGSYYTPEYIVRYIVDQTVGRYLYGTENGRLDGTPLPGQQPKRLEEIDGSNGFPPLTILDPSCGSGSFLMNVYHVLETFYEREIGRLQREYDQRLATLAQEGLSPLELRVELASQNQRLKQLAGYKNQILEKHLYGVDLDPQAAELAAVNLMLRAMSRDMRLPLILNQNIKVGNSLLGGLSLVPEPAASALAPFRSQLAELRRIRLAQQGHSQSEADAIGLQGQFERLAQQINKVLNEPLVAYFGEEVGEKRPFNWIIEFPECFLNADGNLRPHAGFTFVIGNPPYLSVDDTWGKNSADAAYLKEAFADVWTRKSDLYYYFIRRGLSLLVPQGQLGLITARYYLEAYYAPNIRRAILQEAIIQQIVDFGSYTVFPGIGTKTCITLLQREPNAEIRANHRFAFDKAPHKLINIYQFLANFFATSHSLSQADLQEDSWNLFSRRVAQIIDIIDRDTHPLGHLTHIDTGMETGRNDIFGVSQETIEQYQIEPELIRKNIKNQDIKRYNLAFRGLYLIYPEEIERIEDYPNAKNYLEKYRDQLEARAAFQRGGCEWWRFTWPRQKEWYRYPKIVNPNIAPNNRFALDLSTECIGLTDTYAIFPQQDSPDLRYLLALLNSKVLNFRFRYIGKAKDYRYEYFKNGLQKVPIKLAAADVQQQLVTLAQKMLDFNRLRQLLYDEFGEMLQATDHTTRHFNGAYYSHSEYRGHALYRTGPADANAKGTVTSITVREVGSQIRFTITEAEAGTIPLITLELPDPDFRHFLFLALRADLLANERKQIWARGRLLAGTLTALTVPVLNEAVGVANLAQIRQFMQELRHRVTRAWGKEASEPLPAADILDLGAIETELEQTDQQIDTLVFQLYGITDREDVAFILETLL
ncbi:MAG: N-6 DNA methylase [Anaerolineales bacterium]|nr:N-6 DNA methylase [Anaerolineales bacterium]